MRLVSLALIALTAACGGAEAPPVEAPPAEPAPVEAPAVEAPPAEAPAARVFFNSPADGSTVSSPVALSFGVEGMQVKPAGEQADKTGHHHLIINGTHVESGVAVPKDETHIHYGDGSTEATVELEPGQYTLTMQFADYSHASYGEPMATSITITVE